MRTLPETMIRVLSPFAPLFSRRVWQHVRLLLVGAILAPDKRTVASTLRAVGLHGEPRFCRYHRVLSRARWSSREASRILLGLLVETFAPEGPLVLGVDETLERRQGKKIAAKGIYRDPVRSSHTHFVKTSERSEVGMRDAARADPLGLSGLGLTVLERSGSLRAPRHRARQAAQDAHRMGSSTFALGKALAPRRRDRGGSRWHLLFSKAPRPLPTLEKADHLHHPLALRCCSLQTGPATTSRSDRTASPEGKTLAEPFSSCRRSENRVDADPGSRLVRQAEALCRGGLRYGGLAQHGLARCAFALGADPRPAGRVRHPGSLVHRPPCRSGADNLVVCQTLANGGYFPRGSSAPGVRDAKALVGEGDPEDRSCAVGPFLCGHAVRPSAHGRRRRRRCPTNGLV